MIKKKLYKVKLRYGENPNQKAYFQSKIAKSYFDNKIQGKKLSYNNLLDISDGIKCIKEFSDSTCVIIKHNNPCGVASGKNIEKAFQKTLKADSLSAFGGIVVLNRNISFKLAKILNNYFFEVIVAPSFNSKSLDVFKQKKNLILINSKKIKHIKQKNIKSVYSGELFQDENNFKVNHNSIKQLTKKKVSKKNLNDLVFAYKVAKHVKSNSVVLVDNQQTIGIGAGQMSRYDAVRVAIMKKNDNYKEKKFVCASDAFFPFTDNIKLLKKYGCKAIVKPMGSINDEKIIKYAIKNNIHLYAAKYRVFKH